MIFVETRVIRMGDVMLRMCVEMRYRVTHKMPENDAGNENWRRSPNNADPKPDQADTSSCVAVSS